LAAASVAFDEANFDEIINAGFDYWGEDTGSSSIEVLTKDAREGAAVREGTVVKYPSTLSCALNANLEGAKFINKRGYLPLHIAVEHGVTWDEGVEALIKAEPSALTSRNMESQMFPFMLAAAPKTGKGSVNSFRKLSIIHKHATYEKKRLWHGKKVTASEVDKHASKLISAFVDLPILTTIYQLIRANPEPICCGVPIS
jgi:hypothetical protein